AETSAVPFLRSAGGGRGVLPCSRPDISLMSPPEQNDCSPAPVRTMTFAPSSAAPATATPSAWLSAAFRALCRSGRFRVRSRTSPRRSLRRTGDVGSVMDGSRSADHQREGGGRYHSARNILAPLATEMPHVASAQAFREGAQQC